MPWRLRGIDSRTHAPKDRGGMYGQTSAWAVAFSVAAALSGCGGGGGGGDRPSILPFPEVLINGVRPDAAFDRWRTTCDGRDIEITFGSELSCRQATNGGCGPTDCTWRWDGSRVVFVLPETFNALTCYGSIVDLRSGDSNDVFFGRPLRRSGSGPLEACQFRRQPRT
jgi:hypothetical protein